MSDHGVGPMYDQAMIPLYAELEGKQAPKRAVAVQTNERSRKREDVPQKEEGGNGDSRCIAVEIQR